jgi:DNA mismatch endonuclease, patch repair protein
MQFRLRLSSVVVRGFSLPRTPEITHKIMSAVKSRNTKPELALRQALWANGMRFRVNVKEMPGKPDIVFTKAKIAIFVDGDFWHGHNWAIRGISSLDKELEGYSEFWREKICSNIKRDKEITTQLEETGWNVIRCWESEVLTDVTKCSDLIAKKYHSQLRE